MYEGIMGRTINLLFGSKQVALVLIFSIFFSFTVSSNVLANNIEKANVEKKGGNQRTALEKYAVDLTKSAADGKLESSVKPEDTNQAIKVLSEK
jgi:hypothetical protein